MNTVDIIPTTGSKLLDKVKGLEQTIREYGIKNKDSIEVINAVLRIEDLDLAEESKKIIDYMTGEEWTIFREKEEQENNHYTQLKYTLLQKIQYNKFYFKEVAEGSRKIVAHSEDCISTVQINIRKNFPIEVSINMRSSDVEKLLLCDLLGVLKIVNNLYYALPYETQVLIKYKFNFTVLIGSAHYYPEGDIRRKNE